MALKTINIAPAGSETLAAATAVNAAAFNSGESGFIQAIFRGGVSTDNVAGLTAMSSSTNGAALDVEVGSFLPEGTVITNSNTARVHIIINIG